MDKLSINELYEILTTLTSVENHAYDYHGFFAFPRQLIAFRIAYSILLLVLDQVHFLSEDIFRENIDQTDDFLELSIEQTQEFAYSYKSLLEGTACVSEVLYAGDLLDSNEKDLCEQYQYSSYASQKIKEFVLEIESDFKHEEDEGYERPYIACVKCVYMKDFNTIRATSPEGERLLSLCRTCITRAAMTNEHIIDGNDWYILHVYTYGEEQDSTEYMTSPSFFLAVQIMDMFLKEVLA